MMENRIDDAERELVYGEYADVLSESDKARQDVVDRAAYVYVTGQFPSHLRKTYTGILRAVTSYFKKPVAFDGRSGAMKLDDYVVKDLELDKHPMVKEVRKKIKDGYLIQPSRGVGTRRNFWKVFMFKQEGETVVDRVTVQGDGSIKQGWS